MIEVVVALAILGVGVAGLVATQIQTLAAANDAYYRSQALGIAQDVIERIYANPRGWPQLYDGQVWVGDSDNTSPSCYYSALPEEPSLACDTAREMSAFDAFEVRQWLSVSLPDGTVYIRRQCDGAGSVACVSVTWEGDVLASCDRPMVSLQHIKQHHCLSVKFIGPIE